MAKMIADATGVDPNQATGFEPYEGPTPRPGVYWAEIKMMWAAVGKESGNTYFKVLYILGPHADPEKNKCAGAPIFDNVVPGEHELQKARLAQLINVVCGKVKAPVEWDDDSMVITKIGGKNPVGTRVKVTLQRENFKGEPQAKVADVFPFPKGETWPTGDEAGSAVEDLEEEEEIEEGEEGEEGIDDEFEARKTDLEAMTRAKLSSEVKKHDPAFKLMKSISEEDMINKILDVEFPVAEEEEEEDDSAEEEEEEDDSDPIAERRAALEAMDRAAIKAELKAADASFKVLKSHSDADLIEAVLAAEAGAEEEDPF